MPISRLTFFFLLLCSTAVSAQGIFIKNDSANRLVSFGNDKMRLTLGYKGNVSIRDLTVNGQEVVDPIAGAYSAIRTSTTLFSSVQAFADLVPQLTDSTITLPGINNEKDASIRETWKFTVTPDNIRWDIDQTFSKPDLIQQSAIFGFIFKSIDTWEGAYHDYGGLAWFYLFNKKSETDGVHSRSSRLWNSKTGNGLTITVDAPGQQTAISYTRTPQDQLACNISIGDKEMLPRFDSGTNRRRFLRDSTDVWAPFPVSAGTTHQSVTLSYFNFNEEYGRGHFAGINGEEVSGVLNTIARIGVIDKQHFGGNSWHTPYGPICLHEQYIAQMGLAINDPAYLKGYQECLDFYRDNAIKPDGRVWPRWAYTNEDAMPGQFTDKGFYEAQWGFLLDANPDLVTNVAELYDQTGDLAWVKTHQTSCEKALDWICQRDSNHNGLVEMMTDSHLQKRGSDWIDIIWASYENAFVNAKLYHALVLWEKIERQLNNPEKAGYYQHFAQQLKASFNQPINKGGFWDQLNSCYIHWRDKDGSIHGDNMVTPVNFMAIAYGICDNETRKKAILDKIEMQMQKENLFFWPLCLYTYQPGEGNDWQFPFPRYENGDIFLSWGALGVAAYANYRPEIALKYVKNVLQQYAKDGLAFQRYGRAKQEGEGDDILAGNSLSVVGLYQAIYGINPLYNRFYLNPHLTPELNGTQLNYNFRDQKLLIELNTTGYSISNNRFKITATKDFGFYSTPTELLYFHGASPTASLQATVGPNSTLTLNIETWSRDRIHWHQSSKDSKPNDLSYHLNHLSPDTYYLISANGKLSQKTKTEADGSLQFACSTVDNIEFIVYSIPQKHHE